MGVAYDYKEAAPMCRWRVELESDQPSPAVLAGVLPRAPPTRVAAKVAAEVPKRLGIAAYV